MEEHPGEERGDINGHLVSLRGRDVCLGHQVTYVQDALASWRNIQVRSK